MAYSLTPGDVPAYSRHQVVDVIAERDQARDIAVHLEQENGRLREVLRDCYDALAMLAADHRDPGSTVFGALAQARPLVVSGDRCNDHPARWAAAHKAVRDLFGVLLADEEATDTDTPTMTAIRGALDALTAVGLDPEETDRD